MEVKIIFVILLYNNKKYNVMNKKMDRTEKLNFFRSRQRKGDTQLIAERTGYSVSHVINVTAGRRSVPETMANAMYKLSCRRTVLN